MSEQCPSCGKRKCEGEPICGLMYIARSPRLEDGGFHPETVKTAKLAILVIRKLQRERDQ